MKTKKIGILLSAFLLAAMVIVPCVSAYQASSYGTNYGDGMDTTSIALNARNELKHMGYTSSYFGNRDANTAYNRMTSDQVFYFFGHGDAGRILFKESGLPMTAISADNPYLLPTISGHSYSEMNDIALAIYLACNTANTDSTNGNLLYESTSNGVDTAVGFSNYITKGQAAYWSDQFMYYLDEQYNINDAAVYSLVDVRNEYGMFNVGGMDSYVIQGSVSSTIDPQRAGY